MTVINLTPHEVRVMREGMTDVVFPPSGELARLATVDMGATRLPGVGTTVRLVQFGHLQVSPVKHDETWYIVSLPTALAAGRDDFLVPYDEVRDDAGRIIGCRYLARSV